MPTTSRWSSPSCCSLPSSRTAFACDASNAPGLASGCRGRRRKQTRAPTRPGSCRRPPRRRDDGANESSHHWIAPDRPPGTGCRAVPAPRRPSRGSLVVTIRRPVLPASEAHRPVTMTDVATAAGVAQSTVSRILNDAPSGISVSEETRQRVLAMASELGYRPHPFARALRGAPSMLLGAVVRDITDPFFALAVEALSIEAKGRGYSVVLGHAAAKADEALALTAILETRHCDAIVLVGDFRGERRLVEDLRGAHIRVVGLWHGSQRSARPFPTVIVDARAGIRAALRHLTSLGHRRVALRHPRPPGCLSGVPVSSRRGDPRRIHMPRAQRHRRRRAGAIGVVGAI